MSDYVMQAAERVSKVSTTSMSAIKKNQHGEYPYGFHQCISLCSGETKEYVNSW